jgi:uncharacterized secreted repeat protein (TIGR03808 family)
VRPFGITRRHLLGAGLAAALPVGPAGAQALLDGLRGAMDAAQEGLRPGATSNQGVQLAAALAKASAAGQALFLPPGRYLVADVALPARTQMVGIPGETQLVFAGGASMLTARGAARLRLHGLTLDGGGLPIRAAGLLEADTVEDLALDDCRILGSTAAGAVLRSCAGRVERCRIGGVRSVGINLQQSRGMSVAANVVADCGDTGILVQRDAEGPDGTIVTGNRVSFIRAESGGTGQYGNGINLAQANGVIVAGNRIDDCGFSAIRCFSSDDITVTGNIATRSGEMAIYVEFAFEGAVVSGNVIDEAAYGISFANFLEYGGRLAVCADNVIRNISGVPRLPRGDDPIVGVGIGAEADIAISGNVIENAEQGLELGWGEYLRDVSATGNVIRNSPVGIGVSVVPGAGAALIANNLITGATKGAILGMRWAEVATGDLAVSGAEAYPHLTLAANRAG